MQHCLRLFGRAGLSEYPSSDSHYGVGRDEHFAVGYVVGLGLATRDPYGHLFGGKIFGVCLVDAVLHTHLEGQIQACKQLLATRAIGGQN